MGATAAVTDASFADDVLMSTKPVLVDFWAEWCGPCKMIGPILEEIAAAANYGVTSIPTMNVYQNGEIVKQIIGAKPKAALLSDLAEFI